LTGNFYLAGVEAGSLLQLGIAGAAVGSFLLLAGRH
jgi:hypothetical protein